MISQNEKKTFSLTGNNAPPHLPLLSDFQLLLDSWEAFSPISWRHLFPRQLFLTTICVPLLFSALIWLEAVTKRRWCQSAEVAVAVLAGGRAQRTCCLLLSAQALAHAKVFVTVASSFFFLYCSLIRESVCVSLCVFQSLSPVFFVFRPTGRSDLGVPAWLGQHQQPQRPAHGPTDVPIRYTNIDGRANRMFFCVHS